MADTYINYVLESLDPDIYATKEFIVTEYLGSPALLTESIYASGRSLMFIYENLRYYRSFLEEEFPQMDLWILGASYNYTLQIDVNNDIICDEKSCYEQSLKTGKICKPGLYYSIDCIDRRNRSYEIKFQTINWSTPIQVSNRQVFNRQSRADWPLFLKQAKIVQKVFS